MHYTPPPIASQSTRFRLVARMKTPLIVDGVLPLESLLAAAVHESTGQMRDAALAHVPIDTHDGFEDSMAKASGAFFEHGFSLEPVTIIRRITRDEIGPEFFAGNMRQKNPWGFQQDKGDLKALMRQYTQTVTASVSWLAQGDAARCAELLESLMFIGKRRAQGFGQISSVEVMRQPALSASGRPFNPWMDADGRPLRAIPWASWVEMGGRTDVARNIVPCKHPTWASAPELCAVPTRRDMVWDPVAEAKASVDFY